MIDADDFEVWIEPITGGPNLYFKVGIHSNALDLTAEWTNQSAGRAGAGAILAAVQLNQQSRIGKALEADSECLLEDIADMTEVFKFLTELMRQKLRAFHG